MRGHIEKPNLWTAETPNLYYVDFELRAGGKKTHELRERFGFRTFEVRLHDGFFLNGQKIVLQGANRHSFHPDSGRCLAEKDHREDIRLIQELNMNAVRMSHYPPDKRFLELCDESGLYVLNELAGWQKCYSAEAGRPLVEKGPFIYMPTEFLHARYDGGAGAALEDYWNVMRNPPVAGGGFIWALVDEGVKRPDTGKIDVQGNLAPDGILGPYREKEASFYTIEELWSPIVVHERALPRDWKGTLTIEKRYGFTNTSACKFSWELQRMPSPGSKSFVPEIVAQGAVETAPKARKLNRARACARTLPHNPT